MSDSEPRGWRCEARAANMGANDPADCGWPTCGCDPYAGKVIAVLQESGVLQMGRAPLVPDGWQLVPVEPSEEMMVAWDDAYLGRRWRGGVVEAWRAGYAAMLVAAPDLYAEGRP